MFLPWMEAERRGGERSKLRRGALLPKGLIRRRRGEGRGGEVVFLRGKKKERKRKSGGGVDFGARTNKRNV